MPMLTVREAVFTVVTQGERAISRNTVGNKARTIPQTVELALMVRNVVPIYNDRVIVVWLIGKAQIRVEVSDGTVGSASGVHSRFLRST